MKTMRYGLIGCGMMGQEHLRNIALLDDAEAVADLLAADDEANPALRLAAAMAGTAPLRDKLVLVDSGSSSRFSARLGRGDDAGACGRDGVR